MPDQFGNPVYGDQAALNTMNRAAFGDVTAGLMQGGSTVFGGAASGMGQMFSDIGSGVVPAFHTPSPHMIPGAGGGFIQHTTLMQGLRAMTGMGTSAPTFGMNAAEYQRNIVTDFGERVGGGAAAAGTTAAGLGLSGTAAIVAGTAIGGPAGFVAGLGISMVGTVASEAINNAVTQRRQISSFLESSSFRFVGAGSSMSDPITGKGMSRSARRDVAEFIRGQDVSDPELNTQDLSQILEQSSNLGLFNATSDMGDFKRKFKEIVDNVKQVTRVLHTTLEDGLKTIKELKSIGVDPSQAASVSLQADALGKTAGRTGMEMIQAGLQGAEIFRGTGIDMNIGFQATQMNLASIRSSRDAGFLSQQTVAQAGGEEALAMQMNARGLQFSQTSFGRGFNAAFFQGGQFDAGSFNQMLTGNQDIFSIGRQAAGNLRSPAEVIKFGARQAEFLSDMGSMFGGQGLQIAQTGSLVAEATMLANTTKVGKEDAFRFLAKSRGIGEAEIDTMIGGMQAAPATFKSQQAALQTMKSEMELDAAVRNTVFYRAGARVSDVAKDVVDDFAKPVNEFIDDVAAGSRRFYESTLLGVKRVSTRGLDAGGGTIDKASTAAAAKKLGIKFDRSDDVSLDEGGIITTGIGEDLAELIDSGELQRTLRVGEGDLVSEGGVLLDENRGSFTRGVAAALPGGLVALAALSPETAFGPREMRISQDVFNDPVVKQLANLQSMSTSDAKNLVGDMSKAEVNKIRSQIAGLEKSASAADVVQAVYGKDITEISPKEYGRLVMSTKNTFLQSTFDTQRKTANIFKEADSQSNIARLGIEVGKAEKAGDDMRKFAGAKRSMYGKSGRKIELGIEELDFDDEELNLFAEVVRAHVNGDPDAYKAAKEKMQAAIVDTEDGDKRVAVMDMMEKASFSPELQNASVRRLDAIERSGEITVELGVDKMADQMEKGLENKSIGLDEEDDLKRVIASVRKSSDLTTLSSDELDTLSKAGRGFGLVASQAKAMQKIREAGGDKKALQKAISAMPLAGDLDKDQMRDLVSRGTRDGGAGMDDLLADLNTGFFKTMAGKDFTHGQAAVTSADSAAEDTVLKSYDVQTRINTETLNIMSALAGKLGTVGVGAK